MPEKYCIDLEVYGKNRTQQIVNLLEVLGNILIEAENSAKDFDAADWLSDKILDMEVALDAK